MPKGFYQRVHNSRPKSTHCKRGHLRTPETVYKRGACKICQAELRATPAARARRTKQDSSPERRASIRRTNLRKLGWTPERVETFIVLQKGCCAICGDPLIRMSSDHEHVEPPFPRGLLCSNCNAGLGQFQDNPAICEAAASYIRFWRSCRTNTEAQNVDEAMSKMRENVV
jgi:hypothetical protein